MHWTWDPDKDWANLQKHDFDFDVATLVFDDPFSVTVEDPYPHEPRYRTIGMVESVTILVVHTWPDVDYDTGERMGRIISARKATRQEREDYEEGKF